MQGKLILLVGPSGSGKGTLFSFVKEKYSEFVYPTSWTTRAPRAKESGKTYNFVSEAEFLTAKEGDAFLETDHHYNNYYGTPAREIQEALTAGKIVFHELEINGVKQLLQKLPREQVKIIFVTAGEWSELAKRIAEREPVAPDELEKRRLHYEEEMTFLPQADFVLRNEQGKLEETKQELSTILDSIVR
ncbi:hypothetical protein KW798_02160 [Candidatus Parcubacteria bacterium]|nr:hypothetical protein [Candidatus Parcubacteria bacterium]